MEEKELEALERIADEVEKVSVAGGMNALLDRRLHFVRRESVVPGCGRCRSARGKTVFRVPALTPIGGREATATLSGPENQRSGKDPDGGSTPPPSAIIKFLLFVLGSLTL